MYLEANRMVQSMGWWVGDGEEGSKRGVSFVVSFVCLLALVAALSVPPSVRYFMYITTACAFL